MDRPHEGRQLTIVTDTGYISEEIFDNIRDANMSGELLEFPNKVYGMALNLEEDNVGAVILGSDREIGEGDIVKPTGSVMDVPVGDAMIGRVVDALGHPIDGKGAINTTEFRPIESPAPGVLQRKSVNQPLQTGIKAIDAMCRRPSRQHHHRYFAAFKRRQSVQHLSLH